MNSTKFLKFISDHATSEAPLTARDIRTALGLTKENTTSYLKRLFKDGLISRCKVSGRRQRPYGYFVAAKTASCAVTAVKSPIHDAPEPAADLADEQENALDELETALRRIVNIRLRDERREWQSERANLLTKIKKLETDIESKKARRFGIFN